MSMLQSVTMSTKPSGIRAVLAGVEKIGKTTLCCNAPRPLLVPLEVGFAGVSVSMVPMLTHLSHVNTLLDEITEACKAGTFPYKSLVFDSVTALERMIHQAVLESDPTYGKGNKKAMTMESALGGYGKAYTYANELFGNLLARFDELAINAGINIILTCHVFAAEVLDPSAGAYHTWELLLHSPKNQKTYGKREMLTQWADLVGYLHETMTVIENKDMNRGMSNDEGRVLAVVRTPSYVAGNRFNITQILKMPQVNGWNVLADAIWNGTQGRIDVWNRDVIAP